MNADPTPEGATETGVTSLTGYTDAKADVDSALTAVREDVPDQLDTEDDVQTAVARAATCASARRGAEANRKALTAPLNDRKKQIDAVFRELVGPVEGAEQAIKAQIADYRKRKQAEVDAERAKEERNRRERQEREDAKAAEAQAAEAQRAAEENREPEVIEPKRHVAKRIADPAPTMTGGGAKATVRKVWKAEVTDEGEVPREYLKVDQAAINAAVKAGTREIPGVRIFEDDQVAVS